MINHGEKWTQEEDAYLLEQSGRRDWPETARALGRTKHACEKRCELLKRNKAGRSSDSPQWQAQARRGANDYPRMNPPSKANLFEFCAYMAGFNDKSMGF